MRFSAKLLLGLLLAIAPLVIDSRAAAQVPQPPAFAAPLATTTDASYNWAGYVADRGEYTAVSASWTMPAVAPGDETLAADAAWVGIGGVESGDLIQAGTQAIVEDGEVRYEAWYERLPDVSRTVPLPVRAGDSVSVSLAQISEGLWRILFINNTTGKSYALTTRYDSSLSSAEWIEEMPSLATQRGGGSFIPLNDFGSIVFEGARTVKDGVAQTAAQALAQPLSMHGFGGEALAQPSVFGEDGASFAVMRTQASAVAIRPRGQGFLLRLSF